MKNGKTRKVNKISIKPIVINESWLKLFYSQISSEVSLSRTNQTATHTWVITLTAGIIAAVIAIGNGGIIYPNESSYLLLLAILPLLFRFFVRSCLEYQILQRWLSLRSSIDTYYYYKKLNIIKANEAYNYFCEIYKLFYLNWRAAKPKTKMIRDNLLLAFYWPAIMILALIIWGGFVLDNSLLTAIVTTVVSIWMLIEAILFITYRGFQYQPPVNQPVIIE